jgi:ADP-ribosylglycohydrolase
MTPPDLRDQVMGAVLGVVVGDALGVPVEFTARSERDRDPVTGMRGFGTWHQPAGTWSDDGAMTLATCAVLADRGWDLPDVMAGFLRWYDQGWWSAHGHAFDIGNRTLASLQLYRRDRDPSTCGGGEMDDNGNGSLMRCMPVSCWLFRRTADEIVLRAGEASALPDPPHGPQAGR